MRACLSLLFAALVAASCSSSGVAPAQESTPAPDPTATIQPEVEEVSDPGPGGYGFDRSDPEAGIANIMEAFATNEATATCVYDAWGDVANVPPAELTPELMTYEICGTSIFQMITGDPRLTGSEPSSGDG